MAKVTGLLLILAVLAGCSDAESAKKDPQEKLHTYTVTAQTVRSSIDATGMVQPDLEGGAKILAPVAGAVTEVYVRIGDQVRKGQRLASLRSSDATDAHAGYLGALAQLKQAERTYELNRQLFAVGAITKNDLLSSESNYEQMKSLAEGFRKKLDIYGAVSSSGAQDRVILKAPIDGHIVDIQAHIGDRFDTSTPLMAVANPRKIVIAANVFDTDAPGLRKGDEVAFSTDVFPDKVFKGVISGVNDIEDMDSKTIKVYIKLLADAGLLKQNMFLKINFRHKDKRLPTVPKTTIIYKEGKFYVRLKQNDDYTLSEVKPVRDVSESMMAVEGLDENDEIVYSAIDLEKS